MSYSNSKSVLIAGLVAVGVGVAAAPANAAFTLYLQQVGSDVVATGSGTIDTAGLTFFDNGGDTAAFEPDAAVASGGPTTFADADIYEGFTGPTTFGSGDNTFPTSGSGDAVSVIGSAGQLFLPAGYVSGTALSDTDTYANQTFATLGFTPGTYTYTFGSGANADSFVVTSAPEPALSVLALAGLGLLRRRRAGCQGEVR